MDLGESIKKYSILLGVYFICPILAFLFTNPPFVSLFVVNIVLTGLIFVLYCFFSVKFHKIEEDYNYILFCRIFKKELNSKDKKYIRFDIDLFVVALTLVFPNLFFGILLIFNNHILYGISIIPSIVLIGLAIYLANTNYKESKRILDGIFLKLINDLNEENELIILEKISFLKDYNAIVFPRVKIFLLVIGFITSFIMPFIPL